jgi:DNA-binding IclR family transcriptional regulator
MILARVLDYLRRHRRASVADMAQGLGAAPEALREMLAMLERKGRVRRLPAGTLCAGGCRKCDPASVELYEWQGEV